MLGSDPVGHWPPNWTNLGMATGATLPSDWVTLTTVSRPPCTKVGTVSCPLPVTGESWPCRAPDTNQVRLLTLGIGPPSEASKRLKPRLVDIPNGSSVA